MDEILIPGNDDTNFLGKYVIATQGGPAYVRRGRRVEEALEQLLAKCEDRWEQDVGPVVEKLCLVRTMPQLEDRMRPLLADEAELAVFRQLEGRLLAKPPVTILPERQFPRAFRDLIAAIDRFNAAWAAFLRNLDLKPLNDLRTDYNKYYLLEKECALRSPRLARHGYRPLALLNVDDLFARFPLLPRPRLAGE
jgi:hypothetical protein